MADDLFPELDDDGSGDHGDVATLLPPDGTNYQGSRWVRITRLKRSLALDHPWSLLYDELVTKELLSAQRTGIPWKVREPIGMLDLLEDDAVHQGIMEREEAPRFTTHQCIGQMALAMAIKPIPATGA